MARTKEEYILHLKGLLPKGKAWTRSTTSYSHQVIEALSKEFVRLEERIDDLLRESDPRVAVELLSEYEEEYEITEPSVLISQRQADVYAKMISLGGSYKEYFERIALALGHDIEIEEYSPFWSGIGVAGGPCGSQLNLFFWTVLVNSLGDRGGFDLGFDSGFASMLEFDLSLVYGLSRNLMTLIERFNKIKPAHTIALFDYHNVGFSRGFDWGFEAVPVNDNTFPIPAFDYSFDSGFAVGNEDGKYLIGGFDKGFNLGFDVHFGGGFSFGGFDDGFLRPG